MTITPTDGITHSAASRPAGTAGADPAAKVTRNGAAISADFETFLKMLTVQMKNQDPLNPTDPADYAAQLATFSAVEQQVLTNVRLASIESQLSVQSVSQLAGWIGHEAKTEGDIWYNGAPVTLSPTPAPGSNRAVLVVQDEAGRVVSREDIPPGAQSYQWLGAGIDGNPLPAGRYSLSLESWQGDEIIHQGGIGHYAEIVEARADPSGPFLTLKGGIDIAASAVMAFRRAGG